MSDIKSYAVIVAAGKGTRMGIAVPKQFITFHGKPLMCYAIKAFAEAIPGIELILVVPSYHLSSAQIVLKSYLSGLSVTVIPGSDTRYHSVQNGLKEIAGPGIVFVHDGARPLVSRELIQSCYRQAQEKGSAIPAIRITESMRYLEDGEFSKPIDRDRLRIIQTPQTFKTELILPAFAQEYDAAFTDEATVVEAYGTKVHLIDGIVENIKITTQEDLIRAEAMFIARS
jgi:2-C-methyl-D-erythritol 4-phosphate cytidylyltransferase